VGQTSVAGIFVVICCGKPLDINQIIENTCSRKYKMVFLYKTSMVELYKNHQTLKIT